MNRILLIDRDRTLGASLGMACLERGIAIRMAETFCEGVRYLMDAPATAVLVDAVALKAAGADRGRIFETVAPGVPVMVTVAAGTPVEEQVRFSCGLSRARQALRARGRAGQDRVGGQDRSGAAGGRCSVRAICG